MSIQLIPKEKQVKGAFDGGAILENKPIGFPQERGVIHPYSNLFYWANAWSDGGGLIGEHPHKWFEIMSFVLDGEIQHYDNKHNRWISLQKGDVQIIRSGNGITHAEKLEPGGRMFQIWFDPNIQVTMNKQASYDDYKAEKFKDIEKNGFKIKNYVGTDGVIEMDSEGVVINELFIPESCNKLTLEEGKIHSFYLLKGEIKIDNNIIKEDDFFIVENQNDLNFNLNSDARLFHIEVPQKLSYKTYLELAKF